MRITAQEEYGLRCLLQIARAPGGFLTIHEIADREALTTAYVAKLMRVLRRAGFVKSTRGQRGGYALAHAADEVDLDGVLAALGGRLYETSFCKRHAGEGAACVHEVDCAIRSVWTAVDRLVRGALARMKLADLVAPEREVASLGALAAAVPPPATRAGDACGCGSACGAAAGPALVRFPVEGASRRK
jgi:Rrf2 family protein